MLLLYLVFRFAAFSHLDAHRLKIRLDMMKLRSPENSAMRSLCLKKLGMNLVKMINGDI